MGINEYMLKDIPNLADNVLFIAVGQGGGNVGLEMQNLGYKVFYINTSHRDLDTLRDNDDNPIDENYLYHFAGEDGCNKNRNKAKRLAKSNVLSLTKIFTERFSSFTHFCFIYSMGGGSGSGITPMLMKMLANYDDFENKTFMSMAIVPNKKESQKAKINSVECFNDIMALYRQGLIGSSLWISNPDFTNGSSKIEFNKYVAYDVHRILNISSKDVRGTIDQYEALDQLKIVGSINIGDIVKGRKGDRDRFEVSPCFEQTYSHAKSIAYSLVDETDYIRKIMEDSYGNVEIPLVGYRDDNECSYAVIYGLPLPSDVFSEYNDDYTLYCEEQDENMSLELSMRGIEIERPTSRNTRKEKPSTPKIKNKADLDAFFSDIFQD